MKEHRLNDPTNRGRGYLTTNKKLSCNDCDFKVETEEELKRHKQVHKDIQVTKHYTCNSCDQTFQRETILRQHIKEHHRQENKLNCHQCDFQTDSTQMLETHIKSTGHTENGKEITCKNCKKTFKNMETLRDHRRVDY